MYANLCKYFIYYKYFDFIAPYTFFHILPQNGVFLWCSLFFDIMIPSISNQCYIINSGIIVCSKCSGFIVSHIDDVICVIDVDCSVKGLFYKSWVHHLFFLVSVNSCIWRQPHQVLRDNKICIPHYYIFINYIIYTLLKIVSYYNWLSLPINTMITG